MKICFSFFILLLILCSFGNHQLTFEVLKKTNKTFPYQSNDKEFHLIPNDIDTTKIDFVAQVKVKGDDITVFDLYCRLRQESQNLGANGFRIINKAKGGDSYYLLCNIYLVDASALTEAKKNNPVNGQIFIISPEPLKYLNKDRVRVNNTKYILISGTYYSFAKGEFQDSIISIKSKDLNAKESVNNKEVKYYTTRYFNAFSSPQLTSLPVDLQANGGILFAIPINKETETIRGNKSNFKNKDGSIEDGLGNLLLQFSKPAIKK